MKKGAKVLLALGIVFTVVVVAPVVTTYALFYDGSKNPTTYDPDFNIENYLKDTIHGAIENTKDSHSIDLEITEENANSFVQYALGEIQNFPSKYIPQAYIQIDNGDYIFCVAAHTKLFKTKLKIYTHLEYVNDADGARFVFKIKNVKIARLGKLDNIAISVASNFVSDEDIAEQLEKANIHMKVSLKDESIEYKKEDIVKDISSVLNKKIESGTAQGDEIITNVVSDFMQNNILDFDFSKSVKIYANLEPFGSSDKGYIDDSKSLDLDLDKCCEDLVKLYKANIISPDQYSNIYKYFLFGYNGVDSNVKDYVFDKDFSSVGIDNVTTYKGLIEQTDDDLKDVIHDQVTSIGELSKGEVITFMTETQANEYIAGSGFVGYNYLVSNANNDDVNHITVDNFYCNLFVEDDIGHFNVVSGLNFNGYETNIIFDMVEAPEICEGYTMGFKVKDIYFGNKKTSDLLSNYLFQLMGQSLEGDETLNIDYINKTISVDFTDAISDETKMAVSMTGTPKMVVLGDGVSDSNGRICAVIE